MVGIRENTKTLGYALKHKNIIYVFVFLCLGQGRVFLSTFAETSADKCFCLPSEALA